MISAIRISGDQRVVSSLRSAGGKFRDETPAMKLIALTMQRSSHNRFEAEGPGWAPLAESTKKGRRGESFKILSDTKLLALSLTPGTGNQYTINETTEHSATVGTTRPGAWAHQEGVSQGFILRLPRRRFLFHSETDIRDYEKTLADYHMESWDLTKGAVNVPAH